MNLDSLSDQELDDALKVLDELKRATSDEDREFWSAELSKLIPADVRSAEPTMEEIEAHLARMYERPNRPKRIEFRGS